MGLGFFISLFSITLTASKELTNKEKEIIDNLDNILRFTPTQISENRFLYPELKKDIEVTILNASQLKLPDIENKIKQLKENLKNAEQLMRGLQSNYDAQIRDAENLYAQDVSGMKDNEYEAWRTKVDVVLKYVDEIFKSYGIQVPGIFYQLFSKEVAQNQVRNLKIMLQYDFIFKE